MMKEMLSRASQFGISKKQVYDYFNITRQGAAKRIQRELAEQEMMEKIELKVTKYRKNKDFLAGSRSLYMNLDIKQNYHIGITKFEQLMSKYHLTIAPLRIRSLQFYNYERKQKTLGWRTPAEFEKHMMSLPKEERLQKKLYKFGKEK